MKKLFLVLIISLAAINIHGQNQFSEKFAEADLAFNSTAVNKYHIAAHLAAKETKRELGLEPIKEAQFDTLTVRFNVSKIYGAKAIVYTKGKPYNFEIPIIPRINPYKTQLQEGREYFLSIAYNRKLREKKHCSGCNGIVPAGLIWMGITPEQAKKDAKKLKELVAEPEPGYDRSPRY